jgi:hypothetical protein
LGFDFHGCHVARGIKQNKISARNTYLVYSVCGNLGLVEVRQKVGVMATRPWVVVESALDAENAQRHRIGLMCFCAKIALAEEVEELWGETVLDATGNFEEAAVMVS